MYILKIEAAGFFETSVYLYHAWRHIPEYGYFHSHRLENLNSTFMTFVLSIYSRLNIAKIYRPIEFLSHILDRSPGACVDTGEQKMLFRIGSPDSSL